MSAQSPELRTVRGPSAIGGGRRRFFDLLWLMSVTEWRRTYFGTILGYLWSLIRPLAFFGVLLFVFTQVFKIGSAEAEYYPVLLLTGIVLFTLFQEATTAAVTSVVAQEAIVRKTQFPRLVIPLSVCLTTFFNFLLNLVVVVVFLLAFGVYPMWTWLLFPLALVALLVFTVAVATMLSVLYVRFRDIAIIWAVVGQMLLYATPILYPIEALRNATLEHILMINPLAVIFQQVGSGYSNRTRPLPRRRRGGWLHLLPAAAIFVGVCVLSAWIFNRDAPRIAEEL